MSLMKYLIAFGLGFFLSTAITTHEYSLIEKYVSEHCGGPQDE